MLHLKWALQLYLTAYYSKWARLPGLMPSKREFISAGVAADWEDVCVLVSERTSQAVCVQCVWAIAAADLTFTPDLAAPSPRLSQRGQMARTYPTETPSDTHTQPDVMRNTRTSLAPTDLSLNPTMSHPLPPRVCTCPYEFGRAVCIDRSPEVSKSNRSARLHVSLTSLTAY